MAKGRKYEEGTPLAKVFESMIEDMGLGEKLKETKILAALPEILGAGIMKRIDDAYIYDNKLFLKTASAAVRHELMLMKDVLLIRLEEVLDDKRVVDIVLR